MTVRVLSGLIKQTIITSVWSWKRSNDSTSRSFKRGVQ